MRSHKANFFSVGKVYWVVMETRQRIARFMSRIARFMSRIEAAMSRVIYLLHLLAPISIEKSSLMTLFHTFLSAPLNAKALFSLSRSRMSISFVVCVLTYIRFPLTLCGIIIIKLFFQTFVFRFHTCYSAFWNYTCRNIPRFTFVSRTYCVRAMSKSYVTKFYKL